MLSTFHHWLRQRATVRELENLSDRELADLGIERAAIRMIVSRATGATAAAARPSHASGTMAPSWALHNRRALAG